MTFKQMAVADPGFPRWGGGGANLLFWPFFPKYCMKLKKGALLDPQMNGSY